MKTFEHNFIALQCSGMWRPMHWPPGWRTRLYTAFTWSALFILGSLTLAQFIEAVISMDDVEELANNCFMLLTLMADCGKAVNILMKRGVIIEMTNGLFEDPCRPRGEEECAIQRKFDYMVRFNLLRFNATAWFYVSLMVMRSFAEEIPKRLLPFNVWMPFDTDDSLLLYWIVYSHQMIGLGLGAAIGVAFDTLVAAFMLQICAQLNILKHRFIKMPDMVFDMTGKFQSGYQSNVNTLNAESKLLSDYVKHHLQIFKFAEKTSDLFGLMIFLQYTASTLIICASMLQVSHMDIGSSLFAMLSYITLMSVQILMYCFYGGEVTIESINLCDGIYEMDWTVLSVNSKRSLLTIMARTTRPITFTSAHMLTINLESFKSLLKLSYSTFNVLQSTKE